MITRCVPQINHVYNGVKIFIVLIPISPNKQNGHFLHSDETYCDNFSSRRCRFKIGLHNLCNPVLVPKLINLVFSAHDDNGISQGLSFRHRFKSVHFSTLYCCLCKAFPNKPWFLGVCSISLLKTMWEKKKLLVTSNSSFFHSLFYSFGKLSAIFIKLKLSFANSLNLEESKICRLGKD